MLKPNDWQRKRDPDDVPTPIAVALSDYCRRAKSAASPRQVREALALLSQDDDFRVTEIAQAEPTTTGLGPFAVVDMVCGTNADLAQRRQASGYYELLTAFVEEKQRKAPAPLPPPVPVFPPTAAVVGVEDSEHLSRKTLTKQQRAQERILPQKRSESAAFERKDSEALFGAQFLPKRNLPSPRGRFSRVDPEKGSFETLLKTESKAAVNDAVASSGSRYAVLAALENAFSGKKGNPLSIEEVEEALRRHQLLQTLEVKEKDAVLTQLVANKGALGRTAHTLQIPHKSLRSLLETLELADEAEEIRDRFIKEALHGLPLSHRLELLSKTRYLADLDIETRFQKALTKELRAAFDEVSDAVLTDAQAIDLVAKKHGLHDESLRRAVDTLRMRPLTSSGVHTSQST
jgi:hypothetical protein